MDDLLTSRTAAELVDYVSGQSHAMAGAVIAISAAQAAALGQACMQISANLAAESHGNWSTKIDQVKAIKQQLLQLCNRDAGAIAEFVALRDAGKTLAGQKLLCQLPADTGQLSLQVAEILKESRPAINERVQDDLEMSISLLGSAAQAAMLLLDSNLRLWPEQDLLAEFEPIREELEKGIGRLSPVKRIRSTV